MTEPAIVKWKSFLEEEYMFYEGKGDHVFFVIPERRDEGGNSHVEILSKKAIIKFVNQLEGDSE